MRLRYIKEPGQPTELLVDGKMIEVAAEVGRMIQLIWYRMEGTDQLVFEAAIQTVVRNDSPVWSAPRRHHGGRVRAAASGKGGGAVTRYICDPARNTTCDKALCYTGGGPCGLTDDPACAVRDLLGNPVRAANPNTIPMEDNDDFSRKKKYGR